MKYDDSLIDFDINLACYDIPVAHFITYLGLEFFISKFYQNG